MRAFICEVDPSGLRRFIPENLIPTDDLRRLARSLPRPSTTLVWALLAEDDVDDLITDLGAGRNHEAWNLLLNRAVGILPIAIAMPEPSGTTVSAPYAAIPSRLITEGLRFFDPRLEFDRPV